MKRGIKEAIIEILDQLPPDAQREAYEFLSFLKEKRFGKGKKLKQDWAGALEKYKDQYTSLELQKKALEWRGD